MHPDYQFCPRCTQLLGPQELGGHLRSVCGACGFIHWNNPIPVVAAVIRYQDKILLARNAAWPPKMFALITGFLEPGEDPAIGVVREVLEETNLQVQQQTLIGVYPFPRKNELIIAYFTDCVGELQLSEELVDFRLIEAAKLRPWPAVTGLALADWMRQQGHAVNFAPLGSAD